MHDTLLQGEGTEDYGMLPFYFGFKNFDRSTVVSRYYDV